MSDFAEAMYERGVQEGEIKGRQEGEVAVVRRITAVLFNKSYSSEQVFQLLVGYYLASESEAKMLIEEYCGQGRSL